MATQEKLETGGRNTSGSTLSGTRHQTHDVAGDFTEHELHTGEHPQKGMENFRERFNGIKDTVVDRTKQYARVTDDYVNENPWIAVGIGAGIGFLIGMMLSPKGGRRPYA